jgi:replicative DNA helicase
MAEPNSGRDVSGIIYTPAQAASLTVQMVEGLEKTQDQGIPSGIPELDRVMTPMRAGELIVVAGYTSNFKSGTMDYISKNAAALVDREKNEIVVKVTWEQSVEEDTLRWLASDTDIPITQLSQGILNEKEWTVIRTAAGKRIQSPMWIMGHSQVEFARAGKARARMTMNDVAAGMEMIAGGKISSTKHRIRLVVLDYLQRMRPDPRDGDGRREQMMEAVNKAKDLAIAFGVPVLLGVQCGRQVLERDDKLPTIDDGQETSNIEQSCQKYISVWYPIKTEKYGTKIALTGDNGEVNTYVVTPNLLIMGILKQTNGPAPKKLGVFVDPARIKIGTQPAPVAQNPAARV